MTIGQVSNPYIGVGLVILKRTDKPTTDEIKTMVSLVTGVPVEQFCVLRYRKRRLVEARFLCFKLIREIHSDMSLNEIGDLFGGYDHTSVINGIRQIDGRIKYESETAAIYERILTRLKISGTKI